MEEKTKSKEFSVPKINGLMKRHIYLGYSVTLDEDPLVMRLRSFCDLLSKFQLTYSLRSSLEMKEWSLEGNINDGINFSHKCILFITKPYLDNNWSSKEVKLAQKKVKYLGKSSVIAIVDESVKDDPKMKLFCELFHVLPWNEDTIFSDKFVRKYCIEDFELKPQLSSMPKENLGVGVAYTYYYGYLQIILPDIREKLMKKIAEESSDDPNFVVKKMLIIIPQSMNSPRKISEPGCLEQTKMTVSFRYATRCGRERRDYNVPIYKLTPQDSSDKTYYFVGDLPACLFAIFEAYDHQLVGMTEDELFRARNEFYFTIIALLNHPDNMVTCMNKWELLIWPDEDTTKPLSSFIHQEIVAKNLTEYVQNVMDLKGVQETKDRGTFELQDNPRFDPLYAGKKIYDLNQRPRGIFLLINNYKFDDKCLDIDETVAKSENKKLLYLFETQLHFKVELHENLDEQGIKSVMKTYSSADHENYNAFACCIISHGELGKLVCTDGKRIPTLTLTEMFNSNESLKGKPKLFFIEACQVVNLHESTDNQSAPLASLSGGSTQRLNDHPENLGSYAIGEPDATLSLISSNLLVPTSPDFIVSYASLPYSKAWYMQGAGGFYINALCKKLYKDQEIEASLMEVVTHVIECFQAATRYKLQQQPVHVKTCDRLLFLGQ